MPKQARSLKVLTGLSLLCLLPAVFCWQAASAAGGRVDPTAPPATWLELQSPSFAEQGPSAVSAQDANTSHGVQVIVIGKSRKFAIINGQLVKSGDTYNGSQVTGIKSDEVTVDDAAKSVKLAPLVEKKIISPVSKNKAGRASRKSKAPRAGSTIGSGGNQ